MLTYFVNKVSSSLTYVNSFTVSTFELVNADFYVLRGWSLSFRKQTLEIINGIESRLRITLTKKFLNFEKRFSLRRLLYPFPVFYF